MKRILCYGDSNTWGYNPNAFDPVSGASERYNEDMRWPKRMEKLLGAQYCILEEGLNGRTTVFDDPLGPARNGIEHLEAVFRSCDPVDLVVLMLGTNDLKDMFSASAEVVGWGMERLIRHLKGLMENSLSHAAQILLISPVAVAPSADGTYFYGFSQSSSRKARDISEIYCSIAELHGLYFLDASDVAAPGQSDGIHLEESGHAALAEAVADCIMELFS